MGDPRRQNPGSSSWNTLQSSRDLIKIQIPEPFSVPPESRGVCFNPLPRECQVHMQTSEPPCDGRVLSASTHHLALEQETSSDSTFFFFPSREGKKEMANLLIISEDCESFRVSPQSLQYGQSHRNGGPLLLAISIRKLYFNLATFLISLLMKERKKPTH